MSGMLLNGYLLPVAVIVSASSTLTTAGIAWQFYQSHQVHDRALFGSDKVDGHDGVVPAVNENTERSERNRRVLRANDMVPPRPNPEFYRGDDTHDGPDANEHDERRRS